MTNYIGEKIAAGAQLEEYVTERMVALQISGLDRSDYSHKTIIMFGGPHAIDIRLNGTRQLTVPRMAQCIHGSKI